MKLGNARETGQKIHTNSKLEGGRKRRREGGRGRKCYMLHATSSKELLFLETEPRVENYNQINL